MEKSQMKNMVVLKNLPSNLIEEAIVVFKTVKSAKEFQYIDKIENLKNEQSKKNTKDYMVKEAESVISNYIKTNETKRTKTDAREARGKGKRQQITYKRNRSAGTCSSVFVGSVFQHSGRA